MELFRVPEEEKKSCHSDIIQTTCSILVSTYAPIPITISIFAASKT
jgi:hypothetical protein